MTPKTIRLYADGAFNSDAKYGAWAFYVPLFGYEQSGSAEGLESGSFEMQAVIEGVRWILKNQGGPITIDVMTDSVMVMAWIGELGLRLAGRSKKSAIRSVNPGQVLELEEVLRKVPITAHKVSSQVDARHGRCHTVATDTLKIAIQSHPALWERVAVVHKNSRLDRLLAARAALMVRLREIDRAIAEVVPPPLPVEVVQRRPRLMERRNNPEYRLAAKRACVVLGLVVEITYLADRKCYACGGVTGRESKKIILWEEQ